MADFGEICCTGLWWSHKCLSDMDIATALWLQPTCRSVSRVLSATKTGSRILLPSLGALKQPRLGRKGADT
jgi:hypothetical protein